jgi:hypothetical protein
VAAHAPELPDCVTELRQRDVATLLGPSLDGGRGAPAVRRSETEETPREEVAVADAAGCRRRRGAERGGEGFRVCAGGEEEDAGEAGAASCSGHTHGPSSWAALCPGRVTFDYQGRLFKKKRKGKLIKNTPELHLCRKLLEICLFAGALNPVHASTTRALGRLRHPTPPPAPGSPSSPVARSAALLAQKNRRWMRQHSFKPKPSSYYSTPRKARNPQGRSGYTTPRYLSATLHTILATNY